MNFIIYIKLKITNKLFLEKKDEMQRLFMILKIKLIKMLGKLFFMLKK